MKKNVWLSLSVAAILSGCLSEEDPSVPVQGSLHKDLVHFDIYVELLPDTTLNADEQSQQAYTLRLMSRAGYAVTIYQFDNSIHGKSVIRRGVTNKVGNFKALDLPPEVYHITVTDSTRVLKEAVVTSPKGKLTMLTFSFHIPG